MSARTPSIVSVTLAAMFFACGSSDDETPGASSGSPAGVDGGVEADAPVSTEPYPILPYPSGPYSAEVGGVLSDFRVQGYALSPTQRDSRVLPFRDITLAEVRSKPGCECLMIIWSAAGQNCNPCVEADVGMSAAMERTASFCVFELLFTNYDTFGLPLTYVQPPTRADLDAFTQSNRETYPVGLVTESARNALASSVFDAVPTELVLRVSDMRIVAVIHGRHSDLDQEALRYCAVPPSAVETLATGIAPRAIAIDGSYVFVADGSSTILRVPIAGGTAQSVTSTAGTPDLIVDDGSFVTWAARVSSSSFVVERAPKGVGQVATQVTTSPSEITSLATDGTHVYFTRADGTIASAPVGGGNADVLASGEAEPTSILVDDTHVHWLAKTTGEVVQIPKIGGTRKTLAEPSTRKRGQILRGPDAVIVREHGNPDRNTFISFRIADGIATELMPDYGAQSRASIDAVTGIVDFVKGPAGVFPNAPVDQGIAHFSLQADGAGNRWSDYYSGGQKDVVALASRSGYAYWATNGATGGAIKRMKR